MDKNHGRGSKNKKSKPRGYAGFSDGKLNFSSTALKLLSSTETETEDALYGGQDRPEQLSRRRINT